MKKNRIFTAIEYQLHIDLLRCEFCSQHNKLLDFCSACGRARTKRVVVPLFDHKKCIQLTYRCPVCYTQRSRVQHCQYCDLKMSVNRNCEGWVERVAVEPVIEHKYMDGVAQYVRIETGEPVENKRVLKPRWGNAKKKAVKKATVSALPTPSIRSRVFARDGGKCLRCSTWKNLTAHHITHRGLGGKNTVNNLQTLCEHCHAFVHNVWGLQSGVPYSQAYEQEWIESKKKDEERRRKMLQLNRLSPEQYDAAVNGRAFGITYPDGWRSAPVEENLGASQESEDIEWGGIRLKRIAKHGKNPRNYAYGKSLSTNLAAPMITKLRAEAARELHSQ